MTEYNPKSFTKVESKRKSTKLQESKSNFTYSLDTLAQLRTNSYKDKKTNQLSSENNTQKSSKKNYQKRARAKALTNSLLFKLIDVKSPLVKAYWNTYHCSNVLLQEGKTIQSRYCNARWCMVCNRIRTKKLIDGYKKPLESLKDAQFVTLTTPNVSAKHLKEEIEIMYKSFVRCKDNMRKRYGIKLVGIRKVECTYNENTKLFNPHFHLIVEGRGASETLVKLWLKQHPKASPKAQHISKAQEGTIMELFKYFTKVVNGSKFHAKQMDVVFRAMKGKRVTQPFGLKKEVSENIEEIDKQEIDFKESQHTNWIYHESAYDWINEWGEVFSEYNPTPKELKYFESIRE